MFGEGLEADGGAGSFHGAFRRNLSESAHGLLWRVVCHNVGAGARISDRKTEGGEAALEAVWLVINRFILWHERSAKKNLGTGN